MKLSVVGQYHIYTNLKTMKTIKNVRTNVVADE